MIWEIKIVKISKKTKIFDNLQAKIKGLKIQTTEEASILNSRILRNEKISKIWRSNNASIDKSKDSEEFT